MGSGTPAEVHSPLHIPQININVVPVGILPPGCLRSAPQKFQQVIDEEILAVFESGLQVLL